MTSRRLLVVLLAVAVFGVACEEVADDATSSGETAGTAGSAGVERSVLPVVQEESAKLDPEVPPTSAPTTSAPEAPGTETPGAELPAANPVTTTSSPPPETASLPTTSRPPATAVPAPTVTTTVPATTVPATTVPPTTVAPATTVPPTTAPPATTVPPATVPPTTSTTTVPPTTVPSVAGSYVTPADIGSTVGALNPTDTLTGNIDITIAGTTIQNTAISGCITINADNVTIRNVSISCPNTYPIKDNASNGTRVENVTIDCQDNGTKGIYFFRASNFVVDHTEITRCDDQFFIDGPLGSSRISNSVFHNQAPGSAAHTDGMQIGEFEVTTGTLTVESNWWEYNRIGCCENAVLFLSNHPALTVNIVSNYLDGDFGTHVLRCNAASVCNVLNNTVNGTPAGLFIQANNGGGVARCNRFVDGTLLPDSLYFRITVDNSAC